MEEQSSEPRSLFEYWFGESMPGESSSGLVEIDGLVSELRALSFYLGAKEQAERRQIAKKVDDRISQKLAFCEIKLGMLIKSLESQTAASLIPVRELIRQLMKDTRNLTCEISPPVLYDLGLEAAVAELAKANEEEYAVNCFFENDCQPKPLDTSVSDFLFGAVQELLLNSIKHSAAENIFIRMWRQENQLKIVVEDDGSGFDTNILSSAERKGMGLFSIRERLTYMGGYLSIESGCGLGTRVTITVPLKCDTPLIDWI